MYDRNGLELSPMQESMNSYKFTAVNPKARKFTAYAQADRKSAVAHGIYTMVTIARYEDARDAAYVAQTFAKLYNPTQVFEMVRDDILKDVVADFLAELEIPEWQYPAEGLDWDDILGFESGESRYKQNHVSDARGALIEAIDALKRKAPLASNVPGMIAFVDGLYNQGRSYREAAHLVASRLPEREMVH
jgi:hypothetical protein